MAVWRSGVCPIKLNLFNDEDLRYFNYETNVIPRIQLYKLSDHPNISSLTPTRRRATHFPTEIKRLAKKKRERETSLIEAIHADALTRAVCISTAAARAPWDGDGKKTRVVCCCCTKGPPREPSARAQASELSKACVRVCEREREDWLLLRREEVLVM